MEKYNIANLPTKIQKLNNLSKELDTNIYIKRDDFTGSEISGNKVRKLEYLLKDAVDKAYAMVDRVHFDNEYFRHDIGRRALEA